MRKKSRILAMFIVFCMVLTLIPMNAVAASGDGHAIQIELSKDTTTFKNNDVLHVDFKYKSGTNVPVAQSIYLKYDATKLYPVAAARGTDASAVADNFSVDRGGIFTKNNYEIDGEFGTESSEVKFYTIIKDGYGYINWVVTEPQGTSAFSDFTHISSIFFGLKEGVTFDALPKDAIKLATVTDDKAVTAQVQSISISTGTDTLVYGSKGTDTLDVDLANLFVAGKGVTFVKPEYTGTEVKAPTVSQKNGGNVVLMPQNVTDENVEYAYGVSGDKPTSDWQESNIFNKLPAGEYYFFARVKEDGDHKASKSAVSEKVTVYAKPQITSYSNTEQTIVVDSPITAMMPAVSGGAQVSGYSITGTLPQGLTFDESTGAISGTPEVASESATTVKVTVKDTEDITSEAFSVVIPAVNKKENTMNRVVQGNVIYNGANSLVDPEAASNGAAPVFEYKAFGANDSTYTAVKPTKVGKYTVKAVSQGDAKVKDKEITADFEILKKTLTVDYSGITAVIKDYDGTTKAGAITGQATVTGISGDEVGIETVAGEYSSETAGINKNITLTFKLTGKDAGNYQLENETYDFGTAEISAIAPAYQVPESKNIKVGSNLSVFKAVAPESATGVKNEKVSGIVSWYSDTDRNTAATENDVNLEVGNTVTLYWTFTPDSSNYNAVSGSVTFTIVDGDPQHISFSEPAVDKTYGDAPFTNKVFNKDDNGKVITDGGEITWESSNTDVATVDSKTGEVTVVGAGTATITATAAKVAGVYAEGTKSYELNVAKKTVTIEGVDAEDKIYNGNADATVIGTPEIKGLIDGDVVTVTKGTASFSDKNAGANKEVTFAGFELTGKDADNYQLAAQPASVKKEISKKEVTIINVKATDREYNGSVDVALTGAELDGAVTGDDVSVACGKGVVDTPDADMNKPVTVTGYELTGDDKANYELTGQPEGITVTIRKIVNNDIKDLVVSAKYGTTGTADLKALLKEGYLTGAISVTTDTNNIISGTPEFKDGELTYVLNEGTEDASAVITVSVVSATNYIAYDITVTVNATSKLIPVLDVKDFEKTYNGEAVTVADISKAATADGNTIEGTWDFDGVYALTNANAGIPVTVKFTPAGEEFAVATTVITVIINKAKPSGTPEYTKITEDGKTLADADLKSGTITPEGTITWDRPADTTVEKNAEYWWTFTPNDANNYEVLKGKLTPYYVAAPTPGTGGGGILPPAAEKPEITVDNAQGKVELSTDGTTATITPNDGYEIDKVTVNGKEVTTVDNKITGLKTGDKVVVTFKAKAGDSEFNIQKYVSELKLVARSSKTAKGNVKVRVASVKDQNGKNVDLTELKTKGYTVKYKFYRSNKKTSKYAAKTEKTIDKNSYVNTTGKKGTKYYYKARVMVYDNDGKLVAKSELKQCKYASRTWTKK